MAGKNPLGWLSRRQLLATAAGVGIAASTPRLFTPAVAQARKKVTLVIGVPAIDSTTEGFCSSIPLELGLFRDEGLDVDVRTVAGAAAALNLLANGQAQFTSHGVAPLFSGVNSGVPMKSFLCPVPDYFGYVGVVKGGPIKKFEDIKGKTIGIPAEGGAPHLVIKSIVQKLGWEKDTTFLNVGVGLPAMDALRRDRVQALMAWDSIFALFEFNGMAFDYFYPDPIPSLGFTHATNTLTTTMEKDPATVAGMARAISKAIVYQAAAPSGELTKLLFRAYPEAKAAGMPEEKAFELDRLRQAARLKSMRVPQRIGSREERIGDVSDQQVAAHRDLLFNGGQLKEALPVERYFTRQFLDAANDFDIAALVAKAKGMKV